MQIKCWLEKKIGQNHFNNCSVAALVKRDSFSLAGIEQKNKWNNRDRKKKSTYVFALQIQLKFVNIGTNDNKSASMYIMPLDTEERITHHYLKQ